MFTLMQASSLHSLSSPSTCFSRILGVMAVTCLVSGATPAAAGDATLFRKITRILHVQSDLSGQDRSDKSIQNTPPGDKAAVPVTDVEKAVYTAENITTNWRLPPEWGRRFESPYLIAPHRKVRDTTIHFLDLDLPLRTEIQPPASDCEEFLGPDPDILPRRDRLLEIQFYVSY